MKDKVIFYDGDYEITYRELAISVIILLILLSIGWTITNYIRQQNNDRNVRLETALKITAKDIYNHAIDTRLGDIIAYSTMSAITPITNERISGEYSSITEIEEHYVKKTRTETYSCNCDKKGNCKTCTREVEYWEWDEVNREINNSPSMNFFDNEYEFNLFIDYPTHYIDTIKTSNSVRFVYYVIPLQFDTSIIVNTNTGTIKPFQGERIELYVNRTPEETIELEKSSVIFWIILFWIVWLFIIGLIIFGYVYLENDYLY